MKNINITGLFTVVFFCLTIVFLIWMIIEFVTYVLKIDRFNWWSVYCYFVSTVITGLIIKYRFKVEVNNNKTLRK